MTDPAPKQSTLGPVASEIKKIAEAKVIEQTKAFYDDGTGLCFWCPEKAVTQWCGVPLCGPHWDKEQTQMQHGMGVM